jgi:hypothetical protein
MQDVVCTSKGSWKKVAAHGGPVLLERCIALGATVQIASTSVPLSIRCASIQVKHGIACIEKSCSCSQNYCGSVVIMSKC